MFVYSRSRPINMFDSGGRQGEPSNEKLNDVVPYNKELENRTSIGANAQKDHVIAQSKQRWMNPDIDTSHQATVVQETGAARGRNPAKPHTQATFHDPQADVKEIRLSKELEPGAWKGFGQEIVTPSVQSRYRSGYSESATNIAAVHEVGSMFETDQPNRVPGKPTPELDWTKRSKPIGPPVDPSSGKVINPHLSEVGGRAVEMHSFLADYGPIAEGLLERAGWEDLTLGDAAKKGPGPLVLVVIKEAYQGAQMTFGFFPSIPERLTSDDLPPYRVEGVAPLVPFGRCKAFRQTNPANLRDRVNIYRNDRSHWIRIEMTILGADTPIQI